MKSDKELLEEIKGGDQLAFANLYNRYKDHLYAYSLKMMRDTDLAKDIVQEVFIKVYENHLKLISPESFKSWIFTIARNNCFTKLKKSNLFAYSEESYEKASDDDLIGNYEKKEKSEIVKNALDSLKLEYREVLILREYLDYSYIEIADILNTSESAIKSRIFKARKILFEKLQPIFKGNNL